MDLGMGPVWESVVENYGADTGHEVGAGPPWTLQGGAERWIL